MGWKFGIGLVLGLMAFCAQADALQDRLGWPLPIIRNRHVPAAEAASNPCEGVGKQADGSYQFLSDCPGRSLSPDGRFAVVQKVHGEEQLPVEFQDTRGGTPIKLPTLTDDMPYAVTWSPNSKWIMVNHHVGSFLDILQLFEVVGGKAIERHALVNAAERLSARRYPCLTAAGVLPSGVRWSRDSRRLVVVTLSSPETCTDFGLHPKAGPWHNLWMIGDVASGHIDPGSVKIASDKGLLTMPQSGAYAAFSLR